MAARDLVVFCSLALGLMLGGCSGTRNVRSANGAGTGTAVIVPQTGFNQAQAAGVFGQRCGGGQVRLRVCGQCLNGKTRFRVAAGPQNLQVAYVDDDTPLDEKVLTTQAVQLAFTAQAGRTYAVRGQASWSGSTPTVTLWVVDGADGRTVTSIVVPAQNVVIEDEGFDLF